jgi:hypothetical protein
MLDFAKLKTPAGDGEVLVDPAPRQWGEALDHNVRLLGRASVPILGRPLAEWRARTRERIAGGNDRPVVALGHQPDFVHCGVWAKHVAAHRFASAADGVPLNLVVDNDAPPSLSLRVPAVAGQRVDVVRVQFGTLATGRTYEQAPPVSPSDLDHIEDELRRRCSGRFENSILPLFLRGMRGVIKPADWVEQSVAGRRAVDGALGFEVEDRRVSGLWWTPLLREVLGNVDRFADAYNRALGEYRRRQHIRGNRRPIPDLARVEEDREAPFWAYRAGEPRRRLLVSPRGEKVRLRGDDAEIGVFDLRDEGVWEELTAPLSDGGGWRLRPRALALTLWARLFLADLFVHGIGGAKYDRISDAIMTDYFGLAPPRMTCVSATLRLDLPRTHADAATVEAIRRSIRDLEWNPQRHVRDGEHFKELSLRRAAAVRRSVELREKVPWDRAARRAAFDEIRGVNRALVVARPDLLAERRAELERRVAESSFNRTATDREYFYVLQPRSALANLAAALPDQRDFGV